MALMRAVGYAGAGGLGAREDGREDAIEAVAKRDRAGVGRAREDAGGRGTAEASVDVGVAVDVEASDGGTVKTAREVREVNARDAARRREAQRAFRRAFAEPDAREGTENPVERAYVAGRMSSRNPLRRLGGEGGGDVERIAANASATRGHRADSGERVGAGFGAAEGVCCTMDTRGV